MKINWKLRFQNKQTLISLCTLIVTFVVQILGFFEIVPTISEDMAMNIVMTIINVLGIIGVVVDPTTAGIGDSERALTYEEPKKDIEITERGEF